MAKRFGVVLTGLWIVGSIGAGHAADDPRACTLTRGPTATVTSIIDGDTIVLADGTAVRLAGILAPRPTDVIHPGPAWPPAEAARDYLGALVSGRRVMLAYSGRRSDRWGKTLAHVFLARGDDGSSQLGLWIQGRLLSEGHARAYSQPETTACATELLLHEDVARRGHRGLWADTAYAVMRAEQTRMLSEAAGTYVIVEGRVASVTDTRRGTAIRFGSDPQRDFAILVSAPVRRAIVAAGIDLSRISGRPVRVRGWIAVRGGPFMDLHHPQQIEVGERGAAERPDAVADLPVPRVIAPVEQRPAVSRKE